jgi:hypothetical protein
MSRADLVLATRDTAMGMTTSPRLSGRSEFRAEPRRRLSTESRRLWWAMAGDDGPLGLMLVLCFAQGGRFSNDSKNCALVRDRGVGGSNPLAPTTSINKYGLRFDVTSDLRPFLLSFFALDHKIRQITQYF